MTDEILLSKYLSEDEIEEMREEGREVAFSMNVEEAYDIAQKYLTANNTEKAEELINTASKLVDYYKDIVYILTGVSIDYNDVAERWFNTTNGQFVRDPYTPLNMDEEAYEQAIKEKYLS